MKVGDKVALKKDYFSLSAGACGYIEYGTTGMNGVDDVYRVIMNGDEHWWINSYDIFLVSEPMEIFMDLLK